MSENAIFWDKVPKPYIRLRYNNSSGRGERRGAGRRGGAGPSRPAPRLNFRTPVAAATSPRRSAEPCGAVRRGRRSCDPLAGLILSLLKKKTPQERSRRALREGWAGGSACPPVAFHSIGSSGADLQKKKGSPECIRLPFFIECWIFRAFLGVMSQNTYFGTSACTLLCYFHYFSIIFGFCQ